MVSNWIRIFRSACRSKTLEKKSVQKYLTEHKFRVNVFHVTDKLFRNKSLILLFPVAPAFHKVGVSKLFRNIFTTKEDYSHDLPILVLELPRG